MCINSVYLNLIFQRVSCAVRLDLAVIDRKYWFSILSKCMKCSLTETLSKRILSLLNAEDSSVNRGAWNLTLSVLKLIATFTEGCCCLSEAGSSTAPCCRGYPVPNPESLLEPVLPSNSSRGHDRGSGSNSETTEMVPGVYLLWQNTQIIFLHQEGSWV